MKTNISLLTFICFSLFIQNTISLDELKINFSNFAEPRYLNEELRDNDFDPNLFHKKVYIEISDGADYEEIADFLKRNPVLEEFSFTSDAVSDPEMEDPDIYFDRLRKGEDYIIKRAFKDLTKLKKFTLNSNNYTIQKVADRIRAFNKKMPNLEFLTFNHLTIDINNFIGNIETLSASIRNSRVKLEFNNIQIYADKYEKSHNFAKRKEELQVELIRLYNLGLFSSNVYELINSVNSRSNRKVVSFADQSFNIIDQNFNLLDLQGAQEFNCEKSKFILNSQTFRYILKNAKKIALTNMTINLNYFQRFKKTAINVSTFDLTGSTLKGDLEDFLMKIKELKVNKEEGVKVILQQNNLNINQINLLDRLMNEDNFFTFITDAFN